MKHTPAPWKIAEGNTKTSIHNGVTIATISDDAHDWKANARLIAAAPELLEALRELMAQAVKDAEEYAPEGNEPIWAFISDASTAIHKATA